MGPKGNYFEPIALGAKRCRVRYRRRHERSIPSEPIGSIPRPLALLDAIAKHGSEDPSLEPMYEDAIHDTINRFEQAGSLVVTDGEQRKYHNFWTYAVEGLENTALDGFKILFATGHTRRTRQSASRS